MNRAWKIQNQNAKTQRGLLGLIIQHEEKLFSSVGIANNAIEARSATTNVNAFENIETGRMTNYIFIFNTTS